jgi:hypothetical protein
MMKRAVASQVRQFLRAGTLAIIACGPLLNAHAQEEKAAQVTADAKSIDEIVIVVNRAGRPVDIDARRLEEILQNILREFELEQVDQEKEFWRQKFRASLKHSSSRVAFGYDARWEAARVPYMQANILPIDRVKPATIISVRF